MQEEKENSVATDVADDLSKKSGEYAKRTGRRLTRGASRRLFVKTGSLLGKVLKFTFVKGGALLGALLGKISVIIGIALFVLGIIVVAWYVTFELRGASGEYSESGNENQNEFELNEKRQPYEQAVELTGENDAIDRYYKALARDAYWVIDPEDPEEEELVKPSELEEKDYYEQEQTYSINHNFLYSMDLYGHKGEFIYPEQFIKPIYYDEENMEGLSLTDEEGSLIAKSRAYDIENQKFLGDENPIARNKRKVKSVAFAESDEEVYSVHDYGFSSIFKYKKDVLTQYIEGTYTLQDVYDEDCDCVVQKEISEPFKITLADYPIEITLVDQAVTFAQDVTFAYKQDISPTGTLMDGETSDPSSPVNKVFAGTQDIYKTVETELEDGTIETEEVFVRSVDLYKYREGIIFEEKPVPDPENIIEDKREDSYVADYFNYYTSWVPDSYMDGFKFEERAAGMEIGVGLELGSSVDSAKYQQAFQYFPIAEKYGRMYGVDPHLVIAVMAQESGGKNLNSDGSMQITGGTRPITAKNVLTGNMDTFTITKAERLDFDKSVRFGTMFLANLIELHDGNVIKGLQSYNVNPSGFMKRNYPEAWDDDEGNSWLNYREEARKHYAASEGYAGRKSASWHCMPDKIEKAQPGDGLYGDTCYIENVLQYYGGDTLTSTVGGGDDGNKKPSSNSILNVIKNLLGMNEDGEEEVVERGYYQHRLLEEEIENLLTYSQGFEQRLPMSMVEDAFVPLFWTEDFSANDNAGEGGGATIGPDGEGIPGTHGYVLPVQTLPIRITSHFGNREQGGHSGIDIGVPRGTPLYAIGDGTIEETFTTCPQEGWNRFIGEPSNCSSSWGNYVRIKLDGGNHAVYAHMSKIGVEVGQRVLQNEMIGESGNSGSSTNPHLHLEYRLNGSKPINPHFIFK